MTTTPDADHYLKRMLQDMLSGQTVAYWLKRAEAFDDCNLDLALACRRHAWLLTQSADPVITGPHHVPWVSHKENERLERLPADDPFDHPDYLLMTPQPAIPAALQGPKRERSN